jgi:hypothetical protein
MDTFKFVTFMRAIENTSQQAVKDIENGNSIGASMEIQKIETFLECAKKHLWPNDGK